MSLLRVAALASLTAPTVRQRALAANNGGVRLIGILECDTHGEFMVTVLLSRAGTHNANRGRFPRAGRPKVSAA